MTNALQLRRSRSMRRAPTESEHVLWQYLRGRQLGGYKFRRQVCIGAFIVDFSCDTAKLIIEIDGGQHVGSAAYDAARTRWLEAQGYRVKRYWSNEVLSNAEGVLESILRTLQGED